MAVISERGARSLLHDLQRGDFVRLAGIDDEADRLGRDQGAVRLARRV